MRRLSQEELEATAAFLAAEMAEVQVTAKHTHALFLKGVFFFKFFFVHQAFYFKKEIFHVYLFLWS